MRNKTEYRQNVQKSVSMIYEINHIWTSEMKWNENEEMIVAVNAVYEATDFIAQLVEHRTGIARSRVQTPLKSWIFFFFSGFFTQLHKLRSLDDHFFIFKNQFHLPENDWEGLKTTCVQLDIGPPLKVNWQLSKKGIYWTVSDECNARSCVQLTEVRIFFFIKFSVDQILVFAGSRTFKRSSVYFLKLFHKDISSKIP